MNVSLGCLQLVFGKKYASIVIMLLAPPFRLRVPFFFDLFGLLERYQFLWEETVGLGFSPFLFLYFFLCTDFLYVYGKASLGMTCFLLSLFLRRCIRLRHR